MSKYIDADKFIKKFEKMIDDIPASVDSGAGYVIDEVYKIFDSLQQELPSNLDEAANDGWAVYEYRESPRGLYSTCYVDGFKAGAEWMAEQFECVGSYAIPDERGGYWPSDTYYIRKK